MRFYYGAYSQGATGGDDQHLTSGIGFATAPMNRFAGLQPLPRSDQPTLKAPLENIGQVTLKPVHLAGSTILLLNADASAGAVRVEVLDATGKRVRGFSREDAVPIKGDSLRHRVAWRSKSLAELAEGDYMLRLHLENATLYALTFSENAAANK